MRLLVLSDSHGAYYYVQDVIKAHPEADAIIFLGDGERDFEKSKEYADGKIIISVKGNCDFGSSLNAVEIKRLSGFDVYITHGYEERVKHGLEDLTWRAEANEVKLVLYGHTHVQETHYENGIYYMNPGSVSERYYGMVDLTPKGIMLIKARL